MNKDTPQQLLLGFQLDESATLENFQAAAADLQLMQHLHNRVILGQESNGSIVIRLCQFILGHSKVNISQFQ
jgi:hypothetical protein